MTPAYYRSHFKLEYANMALASGIPCVDTLSFQLSLHHLDEKRTPFSFSWSEPFDLDFAGKPRSHPKRSRSLPNPVASKRKEVYSHGRDENQNNAVHREVLGKIHRSVMIEKVGFRAYSHNTCTTTKKLTSPRHEYANTKHCHKDSEEETSDEELSAVAKIFREREKPTTHLPEFFPPHKFSGVAGISGGLAQPPRVRKRVCDENELSGYSSKRSRPSVNFEKMLSSAVGVKVAFEESFFKPIVHSELEGS